MKVREDIKRFKLPPIVKEEVKWKVSELESIPENISQGEIGITDATSKIVSKKGQSNVLSYKYK